MVCCHLGFSASQSPQPRGGRQRGGRGDVGPLGAVERCFRGGFGNCISRWLGARRLWLSPETKSRFLVSPPNTGGEHAGDSGLGLTQELSQHCGWVHSLSAQWYCYYFLY